MIYELVLAVATNTAVCGIPTSVAVTETVPVRYVRVYPDVPYHVPPVTCQPYYETVYKPLDTYPTYEACMQKVAELYALGLDKVGT